MRIHRYFAPTLLFAALSQPALALDNYWLNPAGGLYQAGSNWSLGIDAGVNDTAIFDLDAASPYSILFFNSESIGSLHIGSDDVTFNFSGNTLESGYAGHSLVMGLASGVTPSIMTMTNGQFSSVSDSYIGMADGSEATLNFEGGSWLSSGTIYLADGMGSTATVNSSNHQLDGWQIIVGSNGNAQLNQISLGNVVSTLRGHLEIGQGSTAIGEVNIDGDTAKFEGSSNVGIDGIGYLNALNGGRIYSATEFIGQNAGSIGHVTATGADSRVGLEGGNLNIGYQGTGNLLAQEGGTISMLYEVNAAVSADSTANLTATGDDSLIYLQHHINSIGGDGLVFANALDGGRIFSLQDLNFDNNSNIIFDQNFMRIEGTGSSIGSSQGNLNIFNYDVDIHDGGSLTAFGVISLVGDLDMTGPASMINSGGSTYLGGDIEISQGAQVVSNGGYADGTVTLNGPGTTWSSGADLSIGPGSLNVNGGAEVNVSGNIFGFIPISPKPEINVNGAGSRVTADRLVTNGTVNLDGGDLIITQTVELVNAAVNLIEGQLSANHLELDTNSQINMTGGHLHTNYITGDLVNNGGTVSPGTIDGPAGEGLLFIEGIYSQDASSTLALELGGLTMISQYQALQADGNILLDGTLQIDLVNGFTPMLGDSFEILAGGDILGDFSIFDLPTLGGGLDWSTMLVDGGGYSAYSLEVVSAVPLPAAAWLFIAGLLSLGIAGKRNRRRSH